MAYKLSAQAAWKMPVCEVGQTFLFSESEHENITTWRMNIKFYVWLSKTSYKHELSTEVSRNKFMGQAVYMV
jgi:hypothetical protein